MTSTQRLISLLPESPFIITADRVQVILDQLNITQEELLIELVAVAKLFARPPISNYFVGAAGLGKSGHIYLGVNLEFTGRALNESVHGEQFLVVNASNNGEVELTAIALSAAPCGHCRQFLYETNNSTQMQVITPTGSKMLPDYLPDAFGPKDLGIECGGLLTKQANNLISQSPLGCADLELYESAFNAANESYAVYTQCPSGIALRLKNNEIIIGRYSENVAFNPSLSPLQAALVMLVTKGHEYSDITAAILVEKKNATASQELSTSSLLRAISPDVELGLYKI